MPNYPPAHLFWAMLLHLPALFVLGYRPMPKALLLENGVALGLTLGAVFALAHRGVFLPWGLTLFVLAHLLWSGRLFVLMQRGFFSR